TPSSVTVAFVLEVPASASPMESVTSYSPAGTESSRKPQSVPATKSSATGSAGVRLPVRLRSNSVTPSATVTPQPDSVVYSDEASTCWYPSATGLPAVPKSKRQLPSAEGASTAAAGDAVRTAPITAAAVAAARVQRVRRAKSDPAEPVEMSTIPPWASLSKGGRTCAAASRRTRRDAHRARAAELLENAFREACSRSL